MTVAAAAPPRPAASAPPAGAPPPGRRPPGMPATLRQVPARAGARQSGESSASPSRPGARPLANQPPARQRPGGEERRGADGWPRAKAEEAAVLPVAPVIPQDEVVPLGHFLRSVAAGAGAVAPRQRRRVKFAQRFPVNQDQSLPQFHGLPGEGDHPFHKIARGTERKVEDGDVAPA